MHSLDTLSTQLGPSGITGGGCVGGCILTGAVLQSQKDIITALENLIEVHEINEERKTYYEICTAL